MRNRKFASLEVERMTQNQFKINFHKLHVTVTPTAKTSKC